MSLRILSQREEKTTPLTDVCNRLWLDLCYCNAISTDYFPGSSDHACSVEFSCNCCNRVTESVSILSNAGGLCSLQPPPQPLPRKTEDPLCTYGKREHRTASDPPPIKIRWLGEGRVPSPPIRKEIFVDPQARPPWLLAGVIRTYACIQTHFGHLSQWWSGRADARCRLLVSSDWLRREAARLTSADGRDTETPGPATPEKRESLRERRPKCLLARAFVSGGCSHLVIIYFLSVPLEDSVSWWIWYRCELLPILYIYKKKYKKEDNIEFTFEILKTLRRVRIKQERTPTIRRTNYKFPAKSNLKQKRNSQEKQNKKIATSHPAPQNILNPSAKIHKKTALYPNVLHINKATNATATQLTPVRSSFFIHSGKRASRWDFCIVWLDSTAAAMILVWRDTGLRCCHLSSSVISLCVFVCCGFDIVGYIH